MTIGKYPKTATLPSLGRKGTVPVASASGESGATAQQEPCPACLKELSLLRSGIILPGSMGQPGVCWRCPLGVALSQMTQWNQCCCHQMCPVPKPWQPAVPRAFPGTSQGRGKVENEEKGRSPTTNQPFSWALPLKS